MDVRGFASHAFRTNPRPLPCAWDPYRGDTDRSGTPTGKSPTPSPRAEPNRFARPASTPSTSVASLDPDLAHRVRRNSRLGTGEAAHGAVGSIGALVASWDISRLATLPTRCRRSPGWESIWRFQDGRGRQRISEPLREGQLVYDADLATVQRRRAFLPARLIEVGQTLIQRFFLGGPAL